MKPIGFFILLNVILIASGCATNAPASTPTPELIPTNTSLPASTPALRGLLYIVNQSGNSVQVFKLP